MVAMRLEMTQSQVAAAGSDHLNEKFGFFAILKRFQVATCAVCVSLSLASLTYREPILTLKLTDQMEVSTVMIGLIFALPTISYSLLSIGLQFLPDTTDGLFFGRLMHLGTIILSISLLLAGPATFLPDKLWIMCIGFFVMGAGGALINNNNTSAMYLTTK